MEREKDERSHLLLILPPNCRRNRARSFADDKLQHEAKKKDGPPSASRPWAKGFGNGPEDQPLFATLSRREVTKLRTNLGTSILRRIEGSLDVLLCIAATASHCCLRSIVSSCN